MSAKLAGLDIELECVGVPAYAELGPAYAPFVGPPAPPHRGESHVSMLAEIEVPRPSTGTEVARGMEGGWTVRRDGEALTVFLNDIKGGSGAWRSARHVLGSSAWEVRTAGTLPFLPTGAERPHPWAFPLLDIVTIHHACRSGRALFHACGVVDDGRGLLFVGPSGAGKSTTAGLWAEAGATVLNDDRVLLDAPEHEDVHIFGTPWHGDHQSVAAESAPLAGIFFLEQDRKSWLQPLGESEALPRLLRAAWQPLWDFDVGGRQLWATCRRVLRRCPAYVLHFERSRSAVDVVHTTYP